MLFTKIKNIWNESTRRFAHDGKVLPRWVRLIADLTIIYWCFCFAYFLVERFEFVEVLKGPFVIHSFLYCFIALIAIVSTKLHTGLLRYSNTQDVLRVFICLSIISSVFLFFHNLIIPRFVAAYYQKIMMLLIANFFIAFGGLIMLRVVAKMLFHVLIKPYGQIRSKRVLIYGSGKNAMLVKQALEVSNNIHYIIEGFIDTKEQRLNTLVERRKVFSIKDIPYLSRKKRIDELVVLDDKIGESQKKAAFEYCLESGVGVLMVPPVERWLAGKIDGRQMRKLQIEDLLQRDPIEIDQREVRQELAGKRILITGAAGSIGSEIVRHIIAYQPAILILHDQAESPLHELQLEINERYPDASVEIKIGDICHVDRLYMLFDIFRPEIIFHAAAYKHVPMMESNPIEAVSVNVQGTKILADLALHFKVDSFVMISTDKAVNPTNVMGATKRLAEIYTQSLNSISEKTRFITTRFGNVLGSNGSVIPTFYKQIEKGGPVTVTHPNMTRYFMTIPEAVALVLQAGTMGNGGEIFVFDMGQPVKIVDLAKKMIQLAGLELGEDIDIKFTGLRPGEKLFEEILASTESALPTYHEKIHIAKVRTYLFEEVEALFKELLQLNTLQKTEQLVAKIKEIVPEFKSQNSPFEELDAPLPFEHI